MSCPGLERLEEYLANALPDGERAALEEHLDGCAACRERLDEVCAGAHLVEDMRALLGSRAKAARGGRATGEPELDPGPVAEIVRQLAERVDPFRRYRFQGELARGGMGVIHDVWDQDLRRRLALKVLRAESARGGTPTPSDPRSVGRFLEEARVMARLDHPGVVPVHELGLDDDGRLYFTMQLVEGRTFREIIDRVHSDDDEWTLARAVGVVHRVCETMAHAHHKGVVHRDLKPSNVMVGRFGTVLVMDWGLAHVSGATDLRDIRIRDAGEAAGHRPDSTEDSPLLTEDGHVIGTPAYMPPEQARGELDRVGESADVYSAGALLYHLLTGHVPYVSPGAAVSARTIHFLVLSGPPRPVAELAPDAPFELVAICDKAMAREPEARFASMAEMAEDLRAYTEGRVVRAYETGAWAELRKWVARNRSLAAAILVAVVLAFGGLASTNLVQARATDRILRLSAVETLRQLEVDAEGLWPAHPEHVEEYERWLARAEALRESLPLFEATLASLRERASPASTEILERDRTEHPLHDELRWKLALSEEIAAWLESAGADTYLEGVHADLRADLLSLEEAVGPRRTFELDELEDRWQHQMYAELVAGIQALDAPGGLVADVEQRLAFARTVLQDSVEGASVQGLWKEAREAIADPDRCPQYSGEGGILVVEPQVGLVPLGPDPESGLWEFAHLQTGAVPERGNDGALAWTEDTGLVFVLIPGGSFAMGAQGTFPGGANFCLGAFFFEGPVHTEPVAPFFLSKSEMTQAQWERFTGARPSKYGPGHRVYPVDGRHPVETVSWHESRRTLSRLGLRLPSEAEWEYAARSGSDRPWWFGDDRTALEYAGNVGALEVKDRAAPGWLFEEDWSDDHVIHAPVQAFAPNEFGLYGACGNVSEWCEDRYALYGLETYDLVRRTDGDALLPNLDGDTRVLRGGTFTERAHSSRSASRDSERADFGRYDIGVRPARDLQR